MGVPSSTSVVIPAYNEEASIGAVVEALAAGADWHEILVIDDGSDDGTAAAAHAAGAHVIQHPYNKGNGASVKTGIRQATGEFIVILDADGQHRAALAPRLVARLGKYDLVVGGAFPTVPGDDRPATRQPVARAARRLSGRSSHSGPHVGISCGANGLSP